MPAQHNPKANVPAAASQNIDDLIFDPDITEPCPEQAWLLKAVREFDSYIRANAGRIPNYGERHRAGEVISTAFTESAGQPGHQQAHGQETADALDPARRTLGDKIEAGVRAKQS